MTSKTHSLILILLANASISFAVKTRDCGLPGNILPPHYKPTHYDLDLNPDLDSNVFNGKVDISISTNAVLDSDLNNKHRIVIHAGRDLKIKDVAVFIPYFESTGNYVNQGVFPIKIHDVCHDDKFDLLAIDIDYSSMNFVETNKLIVARINFSGSIASAEFGLLKVETNDHSRAGEVRRIIFTKFGRFGAHHLFPCYDDPSNRVTLRLKIEKISNSIDVVSNADIERVTNEMINGTSLNTYHFKDTSQISIHQFGFALGSFDSVEYLNDFHDHQIGENLTISLVKSSKDPDMSRYVRNVLTTIYRNLARYFGVYLPHGQTLKILSFPGLGSTNEMNVAGLIIMDSEGLMHDPRCATGLDETSYYVAEIVKKLARQWLGNYILTLVIDKESWLFEGLVGWMALKITDEMNMGYNYRILFARNEMTRAMRVDAKPDNQAILHESQSLARLYKNVNEKNLDKRGDYKLDERLQVKATSFINSYEESCAGRFPDVVRQILVKFNNKNFTLAHFLEIIEDICQYNPVYMTRYFVTKSGIPLVRVNLSHGNDLLLHQEIFKHNYWTIVRSDGGRWTKEKLWLIPIAAHLGNHILKWTRRYAFRLVEHSKELRVHLPRSNDVCQPGGWVKLNIQFKGFYRVLYSDNMLNSLLNVAISSDRTQLKETDCINLIDDALAFFKSGKVGAYYLVRILDAMSFHRNEIVQDAMVEAYGELKDIYSYHNPINHQLSQFAIKIFSILYSINRFSMIDIVTNQGKVARARAYEYLAQADFRPLVDDVMYKYRTDPNFWTIDKIYHGAVFTVLARYDTIPNITSLILLLKSPIERSHDLDLVMLSAFAHASSSVTLRLVWSHVRLMESDSIEAFITNLLRNPSAEQFVITDLFPDLTQISSRLGFRSTVEFVKSFCSKLNSDHHCSSRSSIWETLKIGVDNLESIMKEMNEDRKRDIFLKSIDLNKLSF